MLVSKSGIVGCGSSFVDYQTRQPPGVISYIGSTKCDKGVRPDHTVFSLFEEDSFLRSKQNAVQPAGGHVALAYNGQKSFFSIAIVRCDTWAIQWCVERSGCLEVSSILRLVVLSSSLICGVASTLSGSPQLFIASQRDVKRVDRHSNREWREFVAPSRIIPTGFGKEEIVWIEGFDNNSFLVLSLKGSLQLIRVNTQLLGAPEVEGEAKLTTVTRLMDGLRVDEKSRMVVCNGGEQTFVAVFSLQSKSLELLHILRISSGTPKTGDSKVERVSVSTKIPIDTLSFLDPFHLCVTSERSVDNMQFLGIVPGSGTLETISFDPLTSPHTPLAIHYNAGGESLHVLSTMQANSFGALSDSDKVRSLIYTSISFSAGPFTQRALAKASWSLITNPYVQHGPRSTEYVDQGGVEGDLQLLGDVHTRLQGRWVPMTLYYALSGKRREGSEVETAIFSIETAPFLHTRLIKQWHNATVGLKTVLESQRHTVGGALSMAWNPRHMRRALRLLSQKELGALFHSIAATVAASESSEAVVSYCEVATATVDMALQVITLSQQVGAALHPCDIQTIALVLRASRESGHELLRYASRMELLMESSLQQKAMNRILRCRANTSENSDESAESLQKDFYGIPVELQMEHMLHTRYTSNGWAQHLLNDKSAHLEAAQSASKYLAMVPSSSDNKGVRPLRDWREIGARPHRDPLLNEFESTFI